MDQDAAGLVTARLMSLLRARPGRAGLRQGAVPAVRHGALLLARSGRPDLLTRCSPSPPPAGSSPPPTNSSLTDTQTGAAETHPSTTPSACPLTVRKDVTVITHDRRVAPFT